MPITKKIIPFSFILSIVIFIIIIISIIIELFLPNLILNIINLFKSQFNELMSIQYIFLTCFVTSSLNIAVISNRLRDRKECLDKEEYDRFKDIFLDASKKEKIEKLEYEFNKYKNYNNPKTLADRINKCREALEQIVKFLSIHLLIICLTSIRIVLSAFCLTSVILDFSLILGSFLVFSILWPTFFIAYGGGKKIFSGTDNV